ncbi:unnamed protein product [Victoria cruziana]
MDLQAWLCCLLLVSIFLFRSILFLHKKDNLPPGPRGWPVVGNLFQLGSNPYATLKRFARTHGPLFSLRLGTQQVIVASTPSAACLVLRTHESSISSRAVPQVCQYEEYLPYSIVWSDCNDSWKQLRTICRNQLFSGKMLNNGMSLRQLKVEEMVRRLRSNEGEEVCIPDLIFSTIFGMMAAAIFSENAESATAGVEKMKRLACRVLELSTTPNISDYFPAIAGLDVQGLRREAMACYRDTYDIWEGIIAERKKQRMNGGGKPRDDFLEALLSSGLSDLQIKACVYEIFVASSDTTTNTVEWAMAEFMKQPKVLARLRKELSDALSSTGTKDPNLEQKLKELPYFQACIKETLRLHPAVPILPYRATSTCEGFGYTIPKGCQVWVNVWAIGRDPTSWFEPLTFLPDRFIDSPNLDFRGADHRLIPFGSGRRACPGLPLATRLIELILATLVHNFDWSLPRGMDPSQLSMEEKNGLTVPKKDPLQIIPKFIG